MIDRGSIVTVIVNKYIDFPCRKWEEHFVPARKHYIAVEMPSNNGNFRAKDSRGRITWLNVSEVL